MKDYVFLDIETSSLDTEECEILEIAFMITDQNFEIKECYQTLIRPENHLPFRITELTGIKQSMLNESPEFFEIADEIHRKINGKTIIGHNISFDQKVLKRYFSKLDLSYESEEICTLELAQKYYPKLPSHGLDNLCRYFHIPLKEHHRAMSDAKASFELFKVFSYLGSRSKEDMRLSKFDDVIEKTEKSPGVFIIKDNTNKVKFSKASDNLKRELVRYIKQYQSPDIGSIKTIKCNTLTEAFLVQSKFKNRPKWGIYSFKTKLGESFVKLGRFIAKKHYITTFTSKVEAEQSFRELKKEFQKREKPTGKDKASILKRNLIWEQILEKFRPNISNLMIQSLNPINDKYTGYIVYKDKQVSSFESSRPVLNNNDLLQLDLKFQPLHKRDQQAIFEALRQVRNQVQKTENVRKISQKLIENNYL